MADILPCAGATNNINDGLIPFMGLQYVLQVRWHAQYFTKWTGAIINISFTSVLQHKNCPPWEMFVLLIPTLKGATGDSKWDGDSRGYYLSIMATFLGF